MSTRPFQGYCLFRMFVQGCCQQNISLKNDSLRASIALANNAMVMVLAILFLLLTYLVQVASFCQRISKNSTDTSLLV